MKNLNIIIIALLATFFAFTSCQKEAITELTPTTETQRKAKTTQFVNEAATTAFTPEMARTQSNSRTRTFTNISCETGSIYDSTVGQGNTFNAQNLPCEDKKADNFNGPDRAYILHVEDTPNAIVTHQISIKNLQDDLDLFVYTLEADGRVSACKAASITIGLDAETIELRDLAAGCYLVLVDGWIEQAQSSYTFEVACSAVSANPPSIDEPANNVQHLSSVQFGELSYDDGFTILGLFAKTANTKDWKEYGVIHPDFPLDSEMNPARFFFKEVGQDEWSIYLRDDSRGVNIQLDMFSQKVIYSDDEGNHFDLYDILGAN